jgi:hypothetical protein
VSGAWLQRTGLEVALAADAQLGAVTPRPSPLGDAVEALALGARTLVLVLGPLAEPWEMIVAFTRGLLLGPAPAG